MKIDIVKTTDGSYTVKDSKYNECYHSVNGAITESNHIFIQNGLCRYLENNLLLNPAKSTATINILEAGFGTGLNAVLTAVKAAEIENTLINYVTLEKFPLSSKDILKLNHHSLIPERMQGSYRQILSCEWEKQNRISKNFFLTKHLFDLNDIAVYATYPGNYFKNRKLFDIVYYDTFSPETQPELWTPQLLSGIFSLMNNNSMLVTYSSKGDVKRALRQSGFHVKRVEGPPGKRHITIASKV